MKFFQRFFNSETTSTLLATAISGGVIYALTDFGFWACAFFGYVTTEAVSSPNSVQRAQKDLEILNRKLFETQQQVEELSGRLWSLQ